MFESGECDFHFVRVISWVEDYVINEDAEFGVPGFSIFPHSKANKIGEGENRSVENKLIGGVGNPR